DGLIAYRIAAHAGDLVKIREKVIKWDRDITEARRTLNWDKQISLAINPEEAERIRNRRQGQIHSNSTPCTMCGGACVYIMLPQQRMYRRNFDEGVEVPKDAPAIPPQESKSAK
ncbi:MAG: phosphomethylpyrimidine synthase ThiC, partial [Nitrososphaeraceae archaeon]